MPSTPSLLRRVLAALLLGGALLAATASAAAAVQEPPSDARVVDILPVDGLLDPPVARQIRHVIDQAGDRGHELVVLQLDLSGAVSVDLGDLAAAIRASTVPVAVYAGPRTAGAAVRGGALLLVAAAHVRAAAPDAVLGPLVPLDVGDRPGPAEVDEAGRRLASLWPQAPAVLVEDTATGEDAAASLDRVVAGLEPLLVELDGATVTTAAGEQTLRIRRDEVEVRFHTLGLVRRLLHAATTPVFIYLLVVAGLAMLLFEWFQPGFGVAGVAGLVTLAIGAFGLSVLPLHVWALVLVLVGLGVFAVDAAVAGLGLGTALATATFGVGSWFLYDSPVIGLPGWLVVLTTLAVAVFFVVVLTVVLRAQAGPGDAAVESLVGRVGMVRSVLNPEGHVYIDDALWRARWTGESRRAKVGTPVRVSGVDGPVVLVEPFEPATDRTDTSSDQRA